MSTRSGKIFLPLSQTEANIRESFIKVRPRRAFPSVWVQVLGLPKDLMVKDRILAALTMIGRPMEVDELSVRKHETEPVRVRFQCRYPDRIKGTVQLCVNGEPFTISLHAELGGKGGRTSGGPPKPPALRDEGAEDSEDHSSELAPRHNRKNKEKQSQGSAGKGSGGASGGGGAPNWRAGRWGSRRHCRGCFNMDPISPPLPSLRPRSRPLWAMLRSSSWVLLAR
jgi:uncharacterized membrane protein YgcG